MLWNDLSRFLQHLVWYTTYNLPCDLHLQKIDVDSYFQFYNKAGWVCRSTSRRWLRRLQKCHWGPASFCILELYYLLTSLIMKFPHLHCKRIHLPIMLTGFTLLGTECIENAASVFLWYLFVLIFIFLSCNHKKSNSLINSVFTIVASCQFGYMWSQ